MTHHEFEQLYGRQVNHSVYLKLERQYMAEDSTKQEFVTLCEAHHLVEAVAQEMLEETEKKLASLRVKTDRLCARARLDLPHFPIRTMQTLQQVRELLDA